MKWAEDESILRTFLRRIDDRRSPISNEIATIPLHEYIYIITLISHASTYQAIHDKRMNWKRNFLNHETHKNHEKRFLKLMCAHSFFVYFVYFVVKISFP
ncbi:MAG: hypothetical protein FWC89_12850 [Defluviitaleaceae bacterium]|nr:hypothetical protein [Defluviitaleaceae bacterium]